MKACGRQEDQKKGVFQGSVGLCPGGLLCLHTAGVTQMHAISVNELPRTCQQEDQRLLLHFISVLLMARMLSAFSHALAFDSFLEVYEKPIPAG